MFDFLIKNKFYKKKDKYHINNNDYYTVINYIYY